MHVFVLVMMALFCYLDYLEDLPPSLRKLQGQMLLTQDAWKDQIQDGVNPSPKNPGLKENTLLCVCGEVF